MRRTKIVATLGPATRNPEILAGVIKVGADVLRLNFSHGTRDDHERADRDRARGGASARGARSGCSATCPGPKIRLGDIEGDVLQLRHGQTLVLTTDATDGPAATRCRSPGRGCPRRSARTT